VMQCPRCGSLDLVRRFKFCPQCGLPLPQTPSMQKVDDVERKPNEEQRVVETKSASGEGKVISFALIKS